MKIEDYNEPERKYIVAAFKQKNGQPFDWKKACAASDLDHDVAEEAAKSLQGKKFWGEPFLTYETPFRAEGKLIARELIELPEKERQARTGITHPKDSIQPQGAVAPMEETGEVENGIPVRLPDSEQPENIDAALESPATFTDGVSASIDRAPEKKPNQILAWCKGAAFFVWKEGVFRYVVTCAGGLTVAIILAIYGADLFAWVKLHIPTSQSAQQKAPATNGGYPSKPPS